jgi:hypothetical protein
VLCSLFLVLFLFFNDVSKVKLSLCTPLGPTGESK